MTAVPDGALECVLVPHTHWDREWYRTMPAFRARLVGVVDALLDLLRDDPDHRFVLDGQLIVVEDYLAVRPGRRDELAAACAAGRVAVGPWYTQPDSSIPSGEAHIRNLLEGRRIARSLGAPPARVAYVPDSFGHPAQLPQLLAGFGLDSFVYWRGDGNETAGLDPVWRWCAPDGSSVLAVRLVGGYFNGGNPDRDVARAAARIRHAVERGVAARRGDRVLLLDGGDHQPADPTAGALAGALAAATGWSVRRGLLDDFVDGLAGLEAEPPVARRGELRGSALANLLPGGLSTWMPVKVLNRAAETALQSWVEPFAALAAAVGLPDERPAIRDQWRTVLADQAHDSLIGCSADAVMEQVVARLRAVVDDADATTTRVLEQLAGRPTDGSVPWQEHQDLVVFNPSPHPRTDVVRVPLDAFPFYGQHADGIEPHPLALAPLAHGGFTVDGRPARLVPAPIGTRVGLLSDLPAVDLEVLVADVPALGGTRLRLEPSAAADDVVDEGTTISDGSLTVEADPAGGLVLTGPGGRWSGLAVLVDEGDRGDLYDRWPLADDVDRPTRTVAVERRRHPSGIESLTVDVELDLPVGLGPDRSATDPEPAVLRARLTARVAPGVGRVDLAVEIDNPARDHRLRLAFPTGSAGGAAVAATTLDVVDRTPRPTDDHGWNQPATTTFPGQGWVHAGGLTVVAPGLPELEVAADGTVFVTLLRSVGFLSREDHGLRPENAGPGLATPAAQLPGVHRFELACLPGFDPRAAADAESGLRAVVGGPASRLPEGRPLLTLEPRQLLLSAFAPSDEDGRAIIRVLNPTAGPVTGRLHLGLPVTDARTVRLDGTPAGSTPLPIEDGAVEVEVGPHALNTLSVGWAAPGDRPAATAGA